LDEPVGGRAYAPAIAENGTLYVSSAAGVLSLAPDGEVRWKRSLGLVSGTPSLTPDGHVAIGAQGGQVLVLSSERGKTRSKASVGGGVRGSPLVLADGSLVAGAFDNALHRFDAEGRRLFRSALPDRVRGPAAWNGGGTIAVAAGTHVLFMTLRGEIRARATVDDDVVAGPSIADDGTVWVLSDDAVLHALSVEGRSRARAELGGSVSISAELAVGPDGAVRVGTRSALVCIGANGTERWRLTSEGVFGGGVSVDSNGVTLALNQQGRLYAVDAAGKVLWHVDTGARTDATPVLGPDGTVYVSTFGGRLQGWR
jgi:outer membrane protein assembly factor BamB